MKYQTYFDFQQVPYDWYRLWPIFIMLFVSIVIASRSSVSRQKMLLLSLLIVFESVILLFSVISILDQFNYYREKYNTGNYNVVEGIVTNHDPVIYGDGGVERFTVDGVEFVYLGKDPPPPYNRTVAKGGGMANGLRVRVFYTSRYGSEDRWAILRIEVLTP